MRIAKNILNDIILECINEEIIYLNEAKKKKKSSKKKSSKKKSSKKKSKSKEKKKAGGLSSQAIGILNDPMVNNAEIGRQLKDAGILHGSDDTIRSYVSKQRRKLRPLSSSEPTAIVNMSSGD